MDILAISQWVGKNLLIIVSINTCLMLAAFIFFVSANRRLNKYQQILKGNDGKSLEEILLNLAEKTEIVYTKLSKFEEKFLNNQVIEEKHLQNIGLIRFKAFQNSGGDQSFALALLDAAGDGVVISSIFGREESRAYCKPIEHGVSPYPISDEEKEAIEKALGSKLKNYR